MPFCTAHLCPHTCRDFPRGREWGVKKWYYGPSRSGRGRRKTAAVSYAESDGEEAAGGDESESEAEVGFGRMIALCYHSSTLYHIYEQIKFLFI